MTKIAKHEALEMAILLNGDGNYREWLISLVQGAYKTYEELEFDILSHRIQHLAQHASPEHIAALYHYILCMSLEYR